MIARASLPLVAGQVIELAIDERHVYNERDGVGRHHGYVVCVSGAGELLGRTVKVMVDGATRSCAYAHLAPGHVG